MLRRDRGYLVLLVLLCSLGLAPADGALPAWRGASCVRAPDFQYQYLVCLAHGLWGYCLCSS